jgi:hypothetical protein
MSPVETPTAEATSAPTTLTTPTTVFSTDALKGRRPAKPLTLAVFAPFGHDAALSNYPRGQTQRLQDHPLLAALVATAAEGVNVVALIDRMDDYTRLVEIPAGGAPNILSAGKEDMSHARSLASLLIHAHNRFPGTALALALEGHGAGYLPHIDASKLEAANLPAQQGKPFRWLVRPDEEGGAIPSDGQGNTVLPMGESLLPMGESLLPMGESLLPFGVPKPGYPISNWGLGWALAEARRQCKADRLVAIHFNNCFNMALEVLAEVAEHAEWATGYANYNFFTAGRAYPAVMRGLRQATQRTPATLARLFASANQNELAALPVPHPTVGSAIELARVAAVVKAVDALAAVLFSDIKALRGQPQRAALVAALRQAITKAQQYDANGSFELEVPDAQTDLLALAQALAQGAGVPPAVQARAAALAGLLVGVKVYGETAAPWVAPTRTWDFSSDALALNLFFPDPDLRGVWDWRSPYFFAKQRGEMPAQTEVGRFLSSTMWVDFVFEYHRGVAFAGQLAPRLPHFPLGWLRDDRKPPGQPPCPRPVPKPVPFGACVRERGQVLTQR